MARHHDAAAELVASLSYNAAVSQHSVGVSNRLIRRRPFRQGHAFDAWPIDRCEPVVPDPGLDVRAASSFLSSLWLALDAPAMARDLAVLVHNAMARDPLAAIRFAPHAFATARTAFRRRSVLPARHNFTVLPTGIPCDRATRATGTPCRCIERKIEVRPRRLDKPDHLGDERLEVLVPADQFGLRKPVLESRATGPPAHPQRNRADAAPLRATRIRTQRTLADREMDRIVPRRPLPIDGFISISSDASVEPAVQFEPAPFTARMSVKPEEPDISEELEQAYKKLKLSGEVPAGVDENPAARHNYMNELGRRIGLRRRAAAVGEELLLEFNNVKPKDPNQSLFVRFKYDVAVNPPDLSIYSKWAIGDVRQLRLAANPDTPIYSLERKDVIRTFREFSVPADAVAGDGYLAVAFLNAPLNNTAVIFPFEDGLELLYKADTFTANFIRAVLLIFVRLVFLASLAVFAGSFLSFPVAILLCLAIFTMTSMSGFIGESFDVVGGNAGPVYTWFLHPILSLLPHFDKFDPSQFLVPARLLSWSLLASIGFSTLCLRALALVILSLWIFTCREIAKVIV